MDFESFATSFSTCSIVKFSQSAEYIYDNIIWAEHNRIKMVGFINAGITPLAAIVEEIEAYCMNNPINDLDLNNPQVRQTIGRMVASSLAPLGFTILKKGSMTNKNAIFFKNASHYHYTGGASQKIVSHIESV